MLVALIGAGVYVLSRSDEGNKPVPPTPVAARDAASYIAEAEATARTAVCLLVFPGAFYRALGCAEALYLLCGLATFWWAREGRWEWTGEVTFLAGLARLLLDCLTPTGFEFTVCVARQSQGEPLR